MSVKTLSGELLFTLVAAPASKRHPKCLGYTNWAQEFDCEYESNLDCSECKYGGGGGRKDPEAKVNQL